MSENVKVEGKTFLITGGASGLGAGYAESFLKDGAKAVAILDVAEQTGKTFAEKLNNLYPGKVIFIKCDVSDEESVTQAFNEVVKEFKNVDVVVNNAGIMNDSANAWRKMTILNYTGLTSLTLKSIKHMDKTEGGKGGTIINVSSIFGFMRNHFLPIYSGTKAAVLHFTNSIGLGLTEEIGVRMITMCFGATNTPLLNNLEKLSYDDKNADAIANSAVHYIYQRPESAVQGLAEAFKRGSHNSTWLSTDDRPVEDITQLIDNAYESIQRAVYPNMAI